MLNIIKNNKLIHLAILANIVLSLLIAFYYYQSNNEILNNKINNYIKQTHSSFTQSSIFLQEKIQQAHNINRLLLQSDVFTRYVSESSETNRQAVITNWNNTLYNQGLFKQIRYLDSQGEELIRVSNIYDKNAVHELQDKSHRNYFKYAKTLKEGELGIYGVNLEQEFGKFIEPYTPSLRVIMPVSRQHNIKGYMITNYNIDELLDTLTYQPFEEGSLDILKLNGSYLISQDINTTFGDQLPDRAHFNLSHTNPKLWKEIQQSKRGSFQDNDNLYIFNRINFKKTKNSIVVLKTLPLDYFIQQTTNVKSKLTINMFILLLMLFTTTYIYIYRIKNLQNRSDYDLLNSALHNTSSIFITDENFNILKVNDECLKWFHRNETDIINHNIEELSTSVNAKLFLTTVKPALLNQGFWQGDITTIDKNKQPVVFLMRAQRVKNSQAHYVFSMTDITERKIEENQLREYSEKDALTGCWNRRLFDIALKKESALVQRYGSHYHSCLAIIDIDFFKKINDTYGHHRGDDVLVSLAQVMKQSFRETDFIARVGGEEFAVILPQSNLADAYLVLDRFRQTVPKYFDIDVTISGGVIEFSTQLLNAEAYKACDKLLYQAKNSGRNKIVKEEDHQ